VLSFNIGWLQFKICIMCLSIQKANENRDDVNFGEVLSFEVTDRIEFLVNGKDSRRFYKSEGHIFLDDLKEDEIKRVERNDEVFIENLIRFKIGQGTINLHWEYEGELNDNAR